MVHSSCRSDGYGVSPVFGPGLTGLLSRRIGFLLWLQNVKSSPCTPSFLLLSLRAGAFRHCDCPDCCPRRPLRWCSQAFAFNSSPLTHSFVSLSSPKSEVQAIVQYRIYIYIMLRHFIHSFYTLPISLLLN